eukprot:m.194893 g.194893  ORF g.194893 m.194893 type:complete len:51 (-) comp32543_c1_seq2:73-225(-)
MDILLHTRVAAIDYDELKIHTHHLIMCINFCAREFAIRETRDDCRSMVYW